VGGTYTEVLKNRLLRRMFGPKGDEVSREWRRLHDEELNDLYSSPNIIRVIKPRRMRSVGYVACMGQERCLYRDCFTCSFKATLNETALLAVLQYFYVGTNIRIS
jgi:hypothetical protein